MLGNCIVSWSGEAVFACNTAENHYGGALVVYETAHKPFGMGKHSCMITGPAVLEVQLLFSTTPTSSVAGIRHNMIEIVRFLAQEAFWCSITAPYHRARKQPSLLIRAKTIVKVRSLYITALKPFGVGKPNHLKTGPVLMGVPWLFTTDLAFSVAGIRHLPEMVHLIMQGAFWCSVIAPYRGAGKRFWP